jgi:hypothetical protein
VASFLLGFLQIIYMHSNFTWQRWHAMKVHNKELPPASCHCISPCFLGTLNPDSFSCYTSLNIRDQVSHPHTTLGMYSLFNIFWKQMKRQKYWEWTVASLIGIISPLNFLLNQIWLVTLLPKQSNSMACLTICMLSPCYNCLLGPSENTATYRQLSRPILLDQPPH